MDSKHYAILNVCVVDSHKCGNLRRENMFLVFVLFHQTIQIVIA